MIDDPVLVHDWHPVATVEELKAKQLLSVRLLDEEIVLWWANGRSLAWQDLCIHRGTKLSLGRVADDHLHCPYHGWVYDEAGQCIHIPAHPDQVPPTKARAKTYRVQEQYGLVWVCLGEPAHDIPAFAEWHDASYRKIMSGPYDYAAAAPRAIENFLDVAHFPFVHAGYLGDPQHPEINDYEVHTGPDGIVAENITVYQPNPDGTGEGKDVTYTYRVLRPFTAYFIKHGTSNSFAALFTISPITPSSCRAWMWMAMNYGHDVPEAEIRAFQDEVTGQDVPIVQSQRPELLPLDLQAELHLRSDRTAIAYRQWLKNLGVTFGTS
ncbi:MAG: aromatic ring-hydroxylating dioxygenase subunit alpha [Anaerolineaceae bacterium]|nr:aromatic ring-hydroxylating dioxygenase subunit alpha [Anaerolineaceae bacterium]